MSTPERETDGFVGVDEYSQIYERLRDNTFCGTIGGAKVRTSNGANPPAAHRSNLDRILSAAGFITSPDGADEVVQGVFVDTKVARII